MVENDIGWRVASMVDFMFGSPVRIESLAPDPARRALIEETLERVWERSGGIALMQDLATLGHVYGHVDLLVRVDEAALFGATPETAGEAVSIEPIEARRGAPIVNRSDYRELDGYIVLHPGGGDGADAGDAGAAARGAAGSDPRRRGRGAAPRNGSASS